MKAALIIVDVQTGVAVKDIYNREQVLGNIADLLAFCRDLQLDIIYIRHDDGPESDLTIGSDAWQIVPLLKPAPGEMIFDKKYNSMFYKTAVRGYLSDRGIDTILLTGLQTEYCIDASCKAGFEHGYRVIIPEDTTSTHDNGTFSGRQLHEFFTYKIWQGRYAEVVPLTALKKRLAVQ